MKTNKLFPISIYVTILACFSSCMNYYKISESSQNNSTPDAVIHDNIQRYLILRNGYNAYHMSNIVVSDDKKSLICMLDTLSPEHKIHLENGINGNMRYNFQEGAVLDEVHIYVPPDSTTMVGSNYVLMFGKIQKIEVLEKDKKRTANSNALGVAGIAAALSIIAVIVLLSLPSKF